MEIQRYIGVMSGTSMDGADAVLISMDGTRWLSADAHAFLPYPDDLRAELLALQDSGYDELHRSSLLAQRLSRLYAAVIAKLLEQEGLKPTDIAAVGCHGQTVRHAPQHAYSIQLADWALLAELSGILTVGDLRSRDLAAGGQGAPLVPAFHQAVLADASSTRVVLNIGGIANISILPPDGAPFGFDTGAGNMLMDAWMQHVWQQPYDRNGERAAQGRVLPQLLAQWCAHPYFRQPAPKSTGRELFSLAWLQTYLNGSERAEDVLRTLLQFTADTAAAAIRDYAPDAGAVYVCGGGAANALLMTALRQALAGCAVYDTHTLKLHPQWVEAAAFAWLAACWLNRLPGNPHHATGAARAVILGAGYLG